MAYRICLLYMIQARRPGQEAWPPTLGGTGTCFTAWSIGMGRPSGSLPSSAALRSTAQLKAEDELGEAADVQAVRPQESKVEDEANLEKAEMMLPEATDAFIKGNPSRRGMFGAFFKLPAFFLPPKPTTSKSLCHGFSFNSLSYTPVR